MNTARTQLRNMPVSTMLVDASSQALLRSFVQLMPYKDELAVPREVTKAHVAGVEALRVANNIPRLRMLTLRELFTAFEKRVDDVLERFEPDTTVVLLTEALGNLHEPGKTPKSAEWFARWFLEAWPRDGSRPAPVIFDLALAERNGGEDASRAFAELLMVTGGNVAVVVPNDVVYAAQQQPKQMKRLMDWISEACDLSGIVDRVIPVHLAVGYMLDVGRRVIIDMIKEKAGTHPRVAMTALGDRFIGYDGVPLVPGQCIMQTKVPDTVRPQSLADALNGLLGAYKEAYRGHAVMARISAFLDE